ELFIANRRLIVSCIKPFYWIGQVWLPDFLQEGSKALSNAIRKFDFTRGTPFFSYAQVAIQNRLRNYFRDHVRSGNLGIRPTEDMMRMKHVLDKWREDHKDDPPPEILARMTGIDEAKVRKLRPLLNQWERMPYPPASLDAMLGDTTSSLHGLLEDEGADKALALTEKSEIWSAVDRLPERSKFVLQMRFIEGRTLEETGNALNLTRARIKQIQDDSLEKLRNILNRGEHN
ncbi:MAG: sigma-70 family RNA polymerase sigma factor, partial [Methylococcales bacterium]|nr:sigma-70 family RNA polymerase sigma factor [Methylococcales bacterium]